MNSCKKGYTDKTKMGINNYIIKKNTMKRIKYVTLSITFLVAASWAKAQQQPAATKIADKQPPKQELKIIPKEAPANPETANPSPEKRDQLVKKENQPMPVMKLADTATAPPPDPNAAKILAGATEKPAPVPASPSTADPKAPPSTQSKTAARNQTPNQ